MSENCKVKVKGQGQDMKVKVAGQLLKKLPAPTKTLLARMQGFLPLSRHPALDAGSPCILDITQVRGSRINLQKPQILRDDEMGLRMSTPSNASYLTTTKVCDTLSADGVTYI